MASDHHERVRERAYHLWREGGEAAGREMDYWLQAEQEIGQKAPAKGDTAKPKPKAKTPAAKKEAAKPKAVAKPKAAAKPAAPAKGTKSGASKPAAGAKASRTTTPT